MKRDSPARALTLLIASSALAAGCARSSPASVTLADLPPVVDGGKMSTMDTEPAEVTLNLLRFLLDPEVGVVVARIAATRWAPAPRLPEELEHGVIALDVVDVVHGQAPRPGEHFEVHAQRDVYDLRHGRGQNNWNNMDLLPSQLILLVCKPTGTPHVFRPLAAAAVDSTMEPIVQAMRWSYATEALPPEKRREALAKGLASTDREMSYHAFAAIVDRHRLGREEGAEVLAQAIMSSNGAPSFKRYLGSKLVINFPDGHLRNDRTNVLVVAALEQGLLGEQEVTDQEQWASSLRGVLQGRFNAELGWDRALRVALIRSTGVPPRAVLAALTAVSNRPARMYTAPWGDDFWRLLDDYRAAAAESR